MALKLGTPAKQSADTLRRNMYDNNNRHLFMVTRIPINTSRFSWLNKPRVRYGGLQMAVQTYVYSTFDEPRKYEVQVELLDTRSLGEVDMEAYMKRNKVETFIKRKTSLVERLFPNQYGDSESGTKKIS